MRIVNRMPILSMLMLVTSAGWAIEDAEIIVVAQGFGDSADAAKSDALMNAVHQVVGRYVEREALVEQDSLIRDKILRSSESYVQRSEVILEAKQRDDKLWTLTIRASINGDKVKERMRSLGIDIISLDFISLASIAEAKAEDANKGAAILQQQFKGLLPKLMVARLIGQDGKPSESPQPVVKLLADGRISCTWFVEIYFDKRSFYEKVVPPLDELLSTIAIKSGGPIVSEAATKIGRDTVKVARTNNLILGKRFWKGAAPAKPTGDQPFVYFILSTGCSENGGSERFQWYLLEGHPYFPALKAVSLPETHVILNVHFLAEDGGVVWHDALQPWGEHLITDSGKEKFGYHFGPYFLTRFEAPEEAKVNVVLSPRLGSTGYTRGGDSQRCSSGNSDTVVKTFTAVLDPADLERIKEVRFHFSEGKPASGN